MESISQKRERNKQYYLDNTEQIKARVRKYRERNLAKVKAREKAYQDGHREEKSLYDQAYNILNAERIKETKRLWRERNPDKVYLYSKRWKSANHDRVMEHWRKRRAVQRNVEGGHFTGRQFSELCEATGNKCLACKRAGVALTADHIVPLGPPHSDEIENIQPLCGSCNSKKHRKTVDYTKA